ncbi:MAG: peptidoglycan-binding protein, partial [Paracoccus sp. (in: a-proteobacteria)]|nr:peptidoglycan-binding protein [Paracoccus sp. (in: a-proteobacteria)]
MVNLRLAVALALCAGAAMAEDRSVVIANGDYRHLPTMEVGTAAPDALRAAGFRVVSGVDLKASEIRPALADLLREDADPGARLVLLSGRFAHSASDSWFFGTDAEAPDLVTADLQGVPLSVVIDLLGQKKGGAVLFLAQSDDESELGAGLAAGIGDLVLPDGVSVVQGAPRAIESAVNLYLQ